MSTNTLDDRTDILESLAFGPRRVHFELKCLAHGCGRPASQAGRAWVSADVTGIHGPTYGGYELRFERNHGTKAKPLWSATWPEAVDESGARRERLYLKCRVGHGAPVKLETLMRRMLDEYAKGRTVIYFG